MLLQLHNLRKALMVQIPYLAQSLPTVVGAAEVPKLQSMERMEVLVAVGLLWPHQQLLELAVRETHQAHHLHKVITAVPALPLRLITGPVVEVVLLPRVQMEHQPLVATEVLVLHLQ